MTPLAEIIEDIKNVIDPTSTSKIVNISSTPKIMIVRLNDYNVFSFYENFVLFIHNDNIFKDKIRPYFNLKERPPVRLNHNGKFYNIILTKEEKLEYTMVYFS